ncbi:MAG TPA: RNA polymerase sigma factor [Frankiaceae bacterium]|nr:RNA polymerase sigma factor [Frankiaceae bacterium]
MTTSEAAVPGAAREPVARDVESLRLVYADNYTALARFAWRLTGSTAAAEDVVQEAFARLLARRLLVRKPVPFLYRTVTNLANDAWRQRQRDERLRDALGAPAEMPAADASVRDAVRRLPDRERTAVTLYYFADLPVAEVAALMDTPPGTVMWLLSSARTRLAGHLGGPDA